MAALKSYELTWEPKMALLQLHNVTSQMMTSLMCMVHLNTIKELKGGGLTLEEAEQTGISSFLKT